jgi:hypothetical protein
MQRIKQMIHVLKRQALFSFILYVHPADPLSHSPV